MNVIFWIWLQCCLGTDSKKLKSAIEHFGNSENIYRAKEKELRECNIFSDGELSRLLKKDLSFSETTAEKCDTLGYDIICYNEKGYPSRLADIPTPPVVLYVKGKLPDQKLPYAAVVGTRNPDETGKRASYSFGYDIASAGSVVVSGGAYGVDLFAHKGAIEANGRTVCVLGCGIDKFESSISKYLLSEVPVNGAVVSEYPPNYPPRNFTFPARDRIISGLSDCVLTVQARIGSGALITVRYAIEQGRKLFAVPGSMGNAFSSGSNYLLRCGVPAALCGNDIIRSIQYMNMTDHDKAVNPEFSKEQLDLLSKKPEDIVMRKTDGLSMPSVVCYEMFQSVSDISDIPFVQPDEIIKLKPDNESEKTEKGIPKNKAAAPSDNIPETEVITEETEREIIKKVRKPTYTMDKQTFVGLFGERMDIAEIADFIDRLNSKKDLEKAIKENDDIPEKAVKSRKKNKNALKEQEKIGENVKKDEIVNENLSEQLTDTACTVYHTFSDAPVFMDTIAEKTGLSVSDVLSSLTELELYGLIEKLPGQKYVKK